jgi:hypothetical protein
MWMKIVTMFVLNRAFGMEKTVRKATDGRFMMLFLVSVIQLVLVGSLFIV